MTRTIYAAAFLALTILFFFLLPDGIFNNFVLDDIQIGGDGEAAMESYEITVILIKLGTSAAIAAILLAITRWTMRKSPKPK